MSSALRYFGGKGAMARHILPLFPPHETYVELYAGSAAMLVAKPPVGIEVINDLYKRVWNFFNVVRLRGDELAQALELTPYHKLAFEEACIPSDDPLEDARRFVITSFQSIPGGGPLQFTDMWRRDRQKQPGSYPSASKVWDNAPRGARSLAKRLHRVQIDCRDALQAFRDYDKPHNLLYIDPPYHPSTRKDIRPRHGMYAVDATAEHHAKLLELVTNAKAMVVVSGRHSADYDEALKEFDLTEVEITGQGARWGGGERRAPKLECVWRNQAAVEALERAFFPSRSSSHLQIRLQALPGEEA